MSDQRQHFTILDWLGVIVTSGMVALLIAFPVIAKSFDAMFEEFGARAALPAITRLALAPWFPEVLALPAIVALVNGFRSSQSLRPRRLSVVAAFLVAAVGLAICTWGIYAPIFDVADKVKSE